MFDHVWKGLLRMIILSANYFKDENQNDLGRIRDYKDVLGFSLNVWKYIYLVECL